MELLCQELSWRPAETHLVAISMGGMYGLEMLAGLEEGAFSDLPGCAEGRFLSAALLVTQHVGWRLPWQGMPPLAYAGVMTSAAMPNASPKAKVFRGMEQAFSREWLRADTGKTHPKTGAPLTNGQVMVRQGAADYHRKRDEGFSPVNSTSGFLGQMTALATHYVSASRLRRLAIKLAGKCPILVVCAGHDKLVRPPGQHRVAAALKPAVFEVLELPNSSHGVTDENAVEVNSALTRLLSAAKDGKHVVQLTSNL